MHYFEIEQNGDVYRVTHSTGGNGWGLGIDFPSMPAAERVIKAIVAEIEDRPMRYALVHEQAGMTDQIASYLPANYEVIGRTAIRGTNRVQILIGGHDVAGWTLDEYVIPRLASGLIVAEEIA